MEDTTSMEKKHIRPKRRTPTNCPGCSAEEENVGSTDAQCAARDDDEFIQETMHRQKELLNRWTTVKENKKSGISDKKDDGNGNKEMGEDVVVTDTASSGKSITICEADAGQNNLEEVKEVEEETQARKDDENKKPQGILRKPKYSSQPSSSPHQTQEPEMEEKVEERLEFEQPSETFLVRESVMERRKPSKRRVKKTTTVQATTSQKDSGAPSTVVEGYAPKIAQPIHAAVKNLILSNPLEGDSVRQKKTVSFETPTSDESTGMEDVLDHEDVIGDDLDGDEDGGEPLVFNSLADLMEAAGTLPPQDWKEPPAAVEAEISFSCMDRDAYAELLRQQQQEEGDGEDDDETESGERIEEAVHGNLENQPPSSHDDDDDDDDDDDAIWNWGSDEEEPNAEPVLRPTVFLEIWTAFSQWVTPQAVAHVRKLQQNQSPKNGTAAVTIESTTSQDWVPVADTSDLGASRCSGLMSLLQMHLPQATNELFNRQTTDQEQQENPGCQSDMAVKVMPSRSRAEHAVANLLRCFDFSCPMHSSLGAASKARALTCILLDTVLLIDHENWVPPSCREVGLGPDEYHYLTRSALLSFEANPQVPHD